MFSYCICGIPVASEIEVPGLISMPVGTTPPAVTIRFGAVPRELESASEVHATYQIAGDLFLLRIPNIARFLLRAGCEIVIEAEDGAGLDDISAFVVGTAFGVLLHQRDQVVLHASAVRVGGKSVLFCGNSGAGKSTIAAALGQHGYTLHADDVCAVTVGKDGVPVVQPDGRQLKLWAAAIEKLCISARRGAPVRSKLEKFYLESPESVLEPLALGAVYVLRDTRAPLRDGIEETNIVDAAIQIRKSAYRPRLVRLMNQDENYLRSASAISSRAGVFFLNRPLDYAAMPDVIGGLEAHWRQIGILEGAP